MNKALSPQNYPELMTELMETVYPKEGTADETVEDAPVTARVRKVAQGRTTRWAVLCSDCGDVAHRNTHREATAAKVWHMIEKHGEVQ